MSVPAALCPSHGVFTWGKDLKNALKNAIVVEYVAEIAYKTLLLNNGHHNTFSQILLDKHFLRKHGKTNYYGQK